MQEKDACDHKIICSTLSIYLSDFWPGRLAEREEEQIQLNKIIKPQRQE